MRRDLTDLKAGVVGTGFIGAVHVDALRRLGVQVAGVVGSTPDRAAAKALAPVVESYEALLADPAIDVVHLTTPNNLHYPQVKLALEAGKHVVCEKPLATTATQSRELLELAERSGLVHCTNFNIRFYPLVQEARARVQAGELGEVWNVHGGYLQDWLLLPTDWNWRLEPDKGGELRAVGDIGSHWLDLVQFVTGLEVHEIFADLATAIPVRERPVGEVETFGSAAGGERVSGRDGDRRLRAHSRSLPRRRAWLVRRLAGVGGPQERDRLRGERLAERARLGRRASRGAVAREPRHAERTLLRNAALMSPAARPTTQLPAGHAEGFADTFRELYRAVYRAVATGEPADDYPTFRAGHVENVLAEAVALSNAEQRWVEVTP